MKTKTKQVYYCDHCNKHGLSSHMMKYHEKICTKNPKNFRPCFDCIFLTKKEIVIGGNYYNGDEWVRNVDLLFCDKKKIFLYTPKNEIKGNAFDIEEENESMPKECDLLTYKDYI